MTRQCSQRKIIDSTHSMVGDRTRRGKMAYSTLECGHGVKTNATERRKRRTFCFDCFYAKPLNPMSVLILEQNGLEPIADPELFAEASARMQRIQQRRTQ